MNEPVTYQPGWYTNLTNEQYHAANAISSSTIKKYLTMTPRRIQWERLHKPQKPNDAYALGSALHSYLLEPQNYLRDFAISGVWDGRTTEGKKAKAAFLEQSQGKTVIDEIAHEKVIGMANAISIHPKAALALEGTVNESSIFWNYHDCINDQVLGMKVRPDALSPYGGYPAILDIKTTSDASWSGMQKSILNYGYHISAAMYLRGVNQCAPVLDMFGSEFVSFILICVESEPPYQVAIHEIGRDLIDIGTRFLDLAINRYSDAIRDDFPGYPTQVRVIDAPPWADRLYHI